MTKPDWNKAPAWAKYAARNLSGGWYFYAEKPSVGILSWIPSTSDARNEFGGWDSWADSLESRPLPEPPSYNTVLADRTEQAMELKLQHMVPGVEWIPFSPTGIKLWQRDSTPTFLMVRNEGNKTVAIEIHFPQMGSDLPVTNHIVLVQPESVEIIPVPDPVFRGPTGYILVTSNDSSDISVLWFEGGIYLKEVSTNE